MSYATLYNFEGQVEPAVGKLFSSAGITTFTSCGKIESDGTVNPKVDLQRDRPRIEITFTLGPGRYRWHMPDGETDTQKAIESMWSASLAVSLLTDADAVIHLGFLPVVRGIIPTINKVNGTTLLYHTIHGPIRNAGESHTYDPERGFFITRLNVNFDFSIHQSGWALLQQNP